MTETEFLSQIEQDLVAQFIQNMPMREAVRKVLLAGIYTNGTLRADQPAKPNVNLAFGLVSRSPEVTNDQLGADLRASWEGLCALENAFTHMERFVKVEPKEAKPNPAR